ncbi:hypothetical protein Hanom_Chr11g00991181 [Helianthus anomalus]
MKMARFQTFWIQMRKNNPLDESLRISQIENGILLIYKFTYKLSAAIAFASSPSVVSLLRSKSSVSSSSSDSSSKSLLGFGLIKSFFAGIWGTETGSPGVSLSISLRLR